MPRRFLRRSYLSANASQIASIPGFSPGGGTGKMWQINGFTCHQFGVLRLDRRTSNLMFLSHPGDRQPHLQRVWCFGHPGGVQEISRGFRTPGGRLGQLAPWKGAGSMVVSSTLRSNMFSGQKWLGTLPPRRNLPVGSEQTRAQRSQCIHDLAFILHPSSFPPLLRVLTFLFPFPHPFRRFRYPFSVHDRTS